MQCKILLLCGLLPEKYYHLIMILTDNDRVILDAICDIGKKNTSMKEIADRLGISYSYLMHRKIEIARNNGYATTQGMLIDYARNRPQRFRE